MCDRNRSKKIINTISVYESFLITTHCNRSFSSRLSNHSQPYTTRSNNAINKDYWCADTECCQTVGDNKETICHPFEDDCEPAL